MNSTSSALRVPAFRLVKADLWIGAALASSLVFIGLVAMPAFGPERLARHAGHVPMLYAHVIGGVGMLIAGAFALRIGATRQFFQWHRTAGIAYLVTGTVAATSALIRSFDAEHTPGLSTGTLAVVWLVFAALAWRAIRNRRYEQHRDWMIRSYVAGWTFVFCRFFERAVPPDFKGDERDMIWLTWVGPLLLTEVVLQWRRGAASA